MNYYENIAVLDPALSDAHVADATEKITSVITRNGGEIIKSENWGKKNLAYEVNKKKKGYYLFLVFKSPSEVIRKLEDYYKVFDPVFKFMIIKLGKKEVAALVKAIQAAEAKQEKSEEGAPVV
ncbi:MAG: 30S ribosomal protein S6 [bacterium]